MHQILLVLSLPLLFVKSEIQICGKCHGHVAFFGSFANLSNLSPLDITHLASQTELGLQLYCIYMFCYVLLVFCKPQHIKTPFGIFKHQSQSKRIHQVTPESTRDMQSALVVGLGHAVPTSNLKSNTSNRGDPNMGREDTEGSCSSSSVFEGGSYCTAFFRNQEITRGESEVSKRRFSCFRSVCGQKIIDPPCLLEGESGYLPQNPCCNRLLTLQRSFMRLFWVISVDVFNAFTVFTEKEKL